MPAEFDAVMAGVDYPVVVVTTVHPRTGEPSGCLAGFVTQCSIHPPLLLVCLSTSNHTYRVARSARSLAVHLLEPDRDDLAALFGAVTGDEVDKFAACQWRPGPDGLPLLDGCPRWLAGPVLRCVPLGDHVGFVLEPNAFGAGGHGPALMFSAVRDLPAGHEA